MATTDNRKPGMKAPPHMPPPPPEPEQLACPRCNSTNTKFCYYNNYNFSQPRHFCKSCRRYWTHGGTLRDIPVGGATRKNNAANKRPRTAPAPSTSPTCHFPSSQVLFPLAADHGGGAFAGEGKMMSGSFTSLLSDGHPPHQTGSGLLALGGFGLDEAGFGLGRGLLWPAFPGVAAEGSTGGSGHTWQHENGESEFAGGVGYFAISTPASVFK